MSYRQTKIITVALNISMEDPLLLEGPIFWSFTRDFSPTLIGNLADNARQHNVGSMLGGLLYLWNKEEAQNWSIYGNLQKNKLDMEKSNMYALTAGFSGVLMSARRKQRRCNETMANTTKGNCHKRQLQSVWVNHWCDIGCLLLIYNGQFTLRYYILIHKITN
jgi:hypothetical protein